MALVYWGEFNAATDRTMADVLNSSGSETRRAIQDYISAVAAAIISGNATLIAAAEAALAGAMQTYGFAIDYNSSQYLLAHRDANGVFTQLRIRASDGKFPDDVVEDFGIRLGLSPASDGGSSLRGLATVPVFAARAATAVANNEACAVVIVGSSTAQGHLVEVSEALATLYGKAIQRRWPSSTGQESAIQVSRTADFMRLTTPGMHIYNAGDGGTTAATYLTNAECDKIANLVPALMVHIVGSNDFKAQDDPAVYQARMEARLAYLDSVLPMPCQHVLVQAHQRIDFTPPTYQWPQYLTALSAVSSGRQDRTVANLDPAYRAVGIPGSDPLNIMGPDRVHMRPSGHRFGSDQLQSLTLS